MMKVLDKRNTFVYTFNMFMLKKPKKGVLNA